MSWSYAAGVLTSTGATEGSPDSLLAGIAIVQAADATRGYRNGSVAWINNCDVVISGTSFVIVDADSLIDFRGSSGFRGTGTSSRIIGGFIGGPRAKLMISVTTSRFTSFDVGATFITRRSSTNDPAFSIVKMSDIRVDFPTFGVAATAPPVLAKVDTDGLDLYTNSTANSALVSRFYAGATVSNVKDLRCFDRSGISSLSMLFYNATYVNLYAENIEFSSENGFASTVNFVSPVYFRLTRSPATGLIRRCTFNVSNPSFLNNCWNEAVSFTSASPDSYLNLLYTFKHTFKTGLSAVQGVNVRYVRARQSVAGSPTWAAPNAVVTASSDAGGTFAAVSLLDAYREGTSATDLERFNWTAKARSYDRRTAGETIFASRVLYQHSVNMSAGYSEEVQLLAVPNLTLTQAQAQALTGVAFSASGATGGTVTITQNLTAADVWAAYRNWISQTANFDSEDTWIFDGALLNAGAWNVNVTGAVLSASVKTTGTVTLASGGSITGSVEDSGGVRVTVTKSGGGNFNIAARRGTTGAYTDLGYQSNVSTITYTVPKGQPVEVVMWSLGFVTYSRTISTADGGVSWVAEMVANTAINTSLDVSSYVSNIGLSLDTSGANPVFVITFNAPMVVAGIELGKAIIHQLVGQEVPLKSGFPPGSTSTVAIVADEITNNLPAVRLDVGAGLALTDRVYLDFFINTAPALALNPAYVINPLRADGNQVQIQRTKPALDASVLTASVRADIERAGGMLDGKASQASITALSSASQAEHDATQAAISALPAPLNSTQTQAAAAAALVAYDAVVPADLATLATSAQVTALGSPMQASSYTAPPSAASNAAAVRVELAAELARVDVAVSSRLATAGYTAPTAAPSATANAQAVRAELATELGRLDATVSSRLATAGYTAPANADIAAIRAKTETLQNADLTGVATAAQVAAISTVLGNVPTAQENADAVRANLPEVAAIPAAV